MGWRWLLTLGLGCLFGCSLLFPIDDGNATGAPHLDGAPDGAADGRVAQGDGADGPRVDAGGPVVIASREKMPSSIALDGEYVYWLNRGESGPGSGTINGEVVRLKRTLDKPRQAIWAAIGDGNGLVRDGTTLRWVEADNGISGRLGQVEIDGNGHRTMVDVQYNLNSVGADMLHVFFIAPGGLLGRVAKDSSGYTVLRQGEDGVRQVLVTDDGLYLAVWGSVRRVDKEPGGGDILFAATPTEVTALAADETTVYWVSEPGGLVYKQDRATPGAIPVPLADDQRGLSAIAIGGDYIYWTARIGMVMRLPRGPVMGPPTILATGQKEPVGIVADGTAVYWTNIGDGTVMMLAQP